MQINTLDSPKQDQTTLLQPGEHEFIVRQSFVNYKRSKVRSIQDIQRNIDSKAATQKPPITGEILKRICDGVMKSVHTPFEVKELFSRYMFKKIEKK